MLTKVFVITSFWAALFFSIVTSAADNKSLHGGRTKGVFNQIQDKFRSVPISIRNLKVSTPRDKIELIIMANDFTYRIQTILYGLNQATSNMKNQDYKKKLEELMSSSTDLVYDVERIIYGDVEKLQKQLANALESFAVIANKSLETLVKHHEDGEPFINNQLRTSSDMVIWTINRLSSQAAFFTKANKELKKEFDTAFAHLRAVFDKIKTNDEETKDEVRHLIELSELLTNNAVLKLEHWMAINAKDDKSYKIIKETADLMSKLYVQQHVVTTSNLSATEMLKQYAEMYGTGSVKIKKITDAVLPDNLGGQEYARSLILDCITFAGTFSAELELFLAKKNIHAFE